MKHLTGALVAFCLAAGLSAAAAADPAAGSPPGPASAAEQPPPPPPPPKPKPRPKPASFACRDAVSGAEKMICKSFELARLDQQMVRAYDAYMDSLDPDQELTAQSADLAQRRFVIERDRCGDPACVREVYEDRIHVLRSQHSTNMGLRR
jgi:hypothetical protein